MSAASSPASRKQDSVCEWLLLQLLMAALGAGVRGDIPGVKHMAIQPIVADHDLTPIQTHASAAAACLRAGQPRFFSTALPRALQAAELDPDPDSLVRHGHAQPSTGPPDPELGRPAFSQMVVGMPRSALAKASMARLRLPGVLAACAHPLTSVESTLAASSSSTTQSASAMGNGCLVKPQACIK